MRTLTPLTILVAITLPLLVLAQEEPNTPQDKTQHYKVDPVHSSNVFSIKHLNVANFYGRFNEMSGAFTFNDANPNENSLDIQINTASVDTNNDDRDKHLRSADFFDAAKYPLITFKSSAFKKTSDNTYKVRGELALHGKTRSLEVELKHTGSGKDPWGKYRAGWESRFSIKRSDFGMTTMLDGLSDQVDLIISVEGIRQ